MVKNKHWEGNIYSMMATYEFDERDNKGWKGQS